MNIYKLLILIPAIGVPFAIGLFLYARFTTRNVADREQLTTDPLHGKLHALNPQLRIVDEFANVPLYWIKTPGTKDGILFPKSEAAGAKIRLTECDLSAIPPQLLYPRRNETACLEIDNDSHKLSAYFFRTRDGIKDVVAFFEAPLDPTRRFGASGSTVKERTEERRREDGSREFLFSYFLWQRYDLVAFVGYREQPKPKEEGQ
jgi:phosphate/sulfate permease